MKRTLFGLALLALVAGACGDDDDGGSASGSGSGVESTTTTEASSDTTDGGDAGGPQPGDEGVFDPDVDDATLTICTAYFDYAETGNETALLNINLSSDVLGLDAVRDASFFLMENPDPSDAEGQRQHEDANAILQTEIAESGICADVQGDPDPADESGSGSEESGGSEVDFGEATFDPSTDDASVTVCERFTDWTETGDQVAMLDVNLASDVLELGAVRDASFFILENPDPTEAEDQRQFEDAVSILQQELIDSGFCADALGGG